jgi:glucose/arabinose dehydrogenase
LPANPQSGKQFQTDAGPHGYIRQISARYRPPPTGKYEDFSTGFVVNDSSVRDRLDGVAVARDGALLISEDASGTTWRAAFAGE